MHCRAKPTIFSLAEMPEIFSKSKAIFSLNDTVTMDLKT